MNNNKNTTITNWIDDVLSVEFSEEITAIAFNLDGVGVGFVDGDMEILFSKE